MSMSDLDNPVLEPSAILYDNEESDNASKAPETDLSKTGEESPQSEKKEETVDQEESEGSLVYQIGEREITEEQILEWEQGHLRQSDYTQKTMDLADKVRTETSKKVAERLGEIDEKAGALTQHAEALDSLLEEMENPANLEQLREDDYTEYQKTKETIDNRRAKVVKAREVASQATKDAKLARQAEEGRLLIESTPEWSDAKGQATTKREEDFKLINDYAKEVGYTPEEFGQIMNHKMFLAMLDAAKFRQLQAKTTASKKVKVAPKLVKPTQSKSSNKDARSAEEIMYGTAS